jgi:hypothetical protein
MQSGLTGAPNEVTFPLFESSLGNNISGEEYVGGDEAFYGRWGLLEGSERFTRHAHLRHCFLFVPFSEMQPLALSQ